MKKFWQEVPRRNVDVQDESGDLDDATEENTSGTSYTELSVRPEESGVVGVALLSLKEMYKEASILLNKKDSIVEMPFKPNTFMVESDKGRPHYVVLAESGKVTCEGCPRYKAANICAHSISVAEKCNKLKNFLTWFMKSSHTLTTTSYVTCDSAPTVGKKSQKPSTSRRKGGRGQAINIVPPPSASERDLQPTAVPTTSSELAYSFNVSQSIAVMPPTITQPPFDVPLSYPVLPPSAATPSFAAPAPSQGQPLYTAQPPVVYQQSEVRLSSFPSPSQISNALGRVPYPSPLPGQFIVYPLRLCPPQASMCYGCSNSLKPGGGGGQIPPSPRDLVKHSEKLPTRGAIKE